MFYLDSFIKLSCASDMLEKKLFPNVKEITETMGAYEATKKIWEYAPPSDYSIISVFPGDGHVPRTAAMFAYRTAWKCISIDPCLRYGNEGLSKYPGINRLYTIRNKVEKVNLNFKSNIVVIVLVHSHAKIEDCIEHIKGREVYIVSIPCCVKHDLPDPLFIYEDKNILSDKNIVKIWMVK